MSSPCPRSSLSLVGIRELSGKARGMQRWRADPPHRHRFRTRTPWPGVSPTAVWTPSDRPGILTYMVNDPNTTWPTIDLAVALASRMKRHCIFCFTVADAAVTIRWPLLRRSNGMVCKWGFGKKPQVGSVVKREGNASSTPTRAARCCCRNNGLL